MKKPPSNRVSFMGTGDELNYLNDQISYWWWIHPDRIRALAFLPRFEELLSSISKEDESIAFQGHFALLCEAKEDLTNAIVHMRKQIASTKNAIDNGVHLGGGLVVPPNWPKELGVPKYPVDYRFLAGLLCHLADLLQQHGEPKLAREATGEATVLSKQYGFNLARK
jgi:hypothetical protein